MHTETADAQIAVIEPGTIQVLDHQTKYTKRVYTLSANAAQYTDRALLSYCDYTEYFGGTVERLPDAVRVTVYTD